MVKHEKRNMYEASIYCAANQLFEINPILEKNRLTVLLEHPHFFTAFAFHQQKLVLHRSFYEEYQRFLQKKGIPFNI